MSYSWITPVYNRTSTSKYNASDLNRVDNNIRYVDELFQIVLDISTSLSPYTTQTKILLPTASTINTVEDNINALLATLGSTPSGWTTLNANWVGNTPGEFIHSNANALEKNLELLKEEIEEVEKSLLYTGTYYTSTTANQGELVTEELLS